MNILEEMQEPISMEPIIEIALQDLKTLVKDAYPHEEDNWRGTSWRLVSDQEHVRFLNEFEEMFVDCALSASIKQLATLQETIFEQSELIRDMGDSISARGEKIESLQAECQRLDAGWHEANVKGLELQDKLEQVEKDKEELVELVEGICEGIADPLVSMKSGGWFEVKADFLLLIKEALAKYEVKK